MALAAQGRAASTSTIIDLEFVERAKIPVIVGELACVHQLLRISRTLVACTHQFASSRSGMYPTSDVASGLDCIHSPYFLVTGDLSRCIPLCSSASHQGGRDAPLIGTSSCAMSVGKGSQFGTPCFAHYTSLCSSTFGVAMMRCPLNFV